VNALTRILLIVAIVVVALVGLGLGLCGVVGLTLAGGDLFVVVCGISGIGFAIAAGIFIYKILWKALRREDKP
jgi:hypothetical protein